MKKIIICLATGLLTLVSCHKENVSVKDPILITSPSPAEQITKVDLNDTQKGYVRAGNAMAFRFLKQVYEGKNMVCSPLSLQYALAMTANGASGETLQEIIDFLGYGSEGIDALNAYSKILLEQLPAVDLDVTLKVTDALLVNKEYPLLPSFQQTVEASYYAAVDNMDFASPAQIAARINDWARRSTNGFIDNVMDEDEISEDAAAFLMNALYFKAKWAGREDDPLFREEYTGDEQFTLTDGRTKTVQMMRNSRNHAYAEMDGFKVLALPYAGSKYYMYIVLPDKNDLEGLLDKLQTMSWADIQRSLKQDAQVSVKLPKFDIEKKYNLNETLQALGVKRAFQRSGAQFDRMFVPQEEDEQFLISKVIQKARISMAEWGTEAAAVTVVEMIRNTSAGPDTPRKVNFFADHPFVYLIGESTSGTILFEGVYAGE